MGKKLLTMENLGIPKSDITEDLSKYYKIVRSDPHLAVMLERGYGTPEDYVNVLYWIKFVKKMNYHEMDKFTGKTNFYAVYANSKLFWHYNADTLQQCEEMYQKELSSLQEIQTEARNALDEEMPKEYFDTLKDYKAGKIKLRDVFLESYGSKSGEQLIKEIYYLRYVKKVTSKEMSILYNKSKHGISTLLNKLNCKMTLQEAQKLVVEKGRRDYKKAFKTRRETHINTVLDSGLTGSNEENICRIMIADQLVKLIGSERYDVVVGVPDRSIIAPLEVDIPIMIYDKLLKVVKRIAVEYNGDVWHQDRKESDQKKALMLRNLGWEYFALEYHSNSGNITSHFRDAVTVFCEKLAESVLKSSDFV